MKLSGYWQNDVFANEIFKKYNAQNIGMSLVLDDAVAINNWIKDFCMSLLDYEVLGTQNDVDSQLDWQLQNQIIGRITQKISELVKNWRAIQIFDDLKSGVTHNQQVSHPWQSSIVDEQISFTNQDILMQSQLAIQNSNLLLAEIKKNIQMFTVFFNWNGCDSNCEPVTSISPRTFDINTIEASFLDLNKQNYFNYYSSTFSWPNTNMFEIRANIPEVNNINLHKNDLEIAEFQNMVKLLSLDLSNNKLTSFILDSSASNIKTLNLSVNELETISISSFLKLSELSINNNNLLNIQLINLPKLSILDISNNNLTSLTLEDQPNLKLLKLTNNVNLTNISPISANYLENIDVSNCNLTTLEFSACQFLNTLVAYNNKNLQTIILGPPKYNQQTLQIDSSATFNLSGTIVNYGNLWNLINVPAGWSVVSSIN